MRKIFLFGVILIGLTVALSLSSCGEREKIKKVSLYEKREEEIKETPGAVRIAVGAMISPRKTFTYYQELFDCLSRRIGRPVTLVQRRTYKEVNDLLRKGELECAFVCSGAYIEAARDGAVELLVVPVVKGEPLYYSYIIVHKDSPIDSFEALKAKSFAFTDPLSNTGRLYPTYLLADKGLIPEVFFSKTIFTHSHDNSIRAVAERLVDGAAVDSLIWDYFHATDPGFTSRTKIILKSPPFGIPPVVVPKSLDPELKKELSEIFLSLHQDEESKEILNKIMIDKFIPGEDSMYDFVREMRAVVEELR